MGCHAAMDAELRTLHVLDKELRTSAECRCGLLASRARCLERRRAAHTSSTCPHHPRAPCRPHDCVCARGCTGLSHGRHAVRVSRCRGGEHRVMGRQPARAHAPLTHPPHLPASPPCSFDIGIVGGVEVGVGQGRLRQGLLWPPWFAGKPADAAGRAALMASHASLPRCVSCSPAPHHACPRRTPPPGHGHVSVILLPRDIRLQHARRGRQRPM